MAISRGLIVIVSGPAGVGKTTVVERLKREPGYCASISATTRLPRPGERALVDYQFVNRTAFERMRQDGLFLEWASVHDNYYGTPRGPVEERLGEGRNVLLNIDVQGAAQIRDKGLPVVSFFLCPPSIDALRERIAKRRSAETPEQIERRLDTAKAEIARANEYDYKIVNDDLERTVAEIRDIVNRRRDGDATKPED